MDKNLERLSNMNKEADMVNHPPHYCRENGMECIDEMELIFGKEETMTFCKLNAWKYRYRAADKNGQQDLEKSDWYIRKYKELKEKKKQTFYDENWLLSENEIEKLYGQK